MATRRYLRLTPEVTWGTFDTLGTSHIIDLDTANSYTPRIKRNDQDIRTAGGRNRPVLKVSKTASLTGNLNMIVRRSQADVLSSWFCAAPSTDALTSMTIDYVTEMEGGTLYYHRHLGMMVSEANIASTAASKLVRLSLQLVGKEPATITATDFAEPAATDYPTDAVFTHQDLAGNFSIAGSSRTQFDDLNITIKNMLDVRFFESQYPSLIRFCGRDVTWTSSVLFKSATDRTAYEAATAVSATAAFNNGTKTWTFNFKGNNYYSGVDDDIDDGKAYSQKLNLQTFWDTTSTANDLVVTVA